MGTSQERIKKIIEDMARGKSVNDRLVYDSVEKIVKPQSQLNKQNRYVAIEPSEADLYSDKKDATLISISGEVIKYSLAQPQTQLSFTTWDNGTVFSFINNNPAPEKVLGTIYVRQNQGKKISKISRNKDDVVRIIISKKRRKGDHITFNDTFIIKGFIRQQGIWKNAAIRIIPVKEELFSRFGGLLETDKMSNKTVAVIGLGSGGSTVITLLAQCGVGKFIAMDHDRFEVGNVSRHVAGISHVGRFKPYIIADLIHDINPHAEVQTFVIKVSWDTKEIIRKLIAQVDAVVCCTDHRNSKLIINRFCVENNKPFITAGAFRRAYGGQVHVFRESGVSPCYQCFLSYLPEEANDVEISSAAQAHGLAYTDREVEIEPGLFNDINPISQMVVKQTIQILLKNEETTLRSLDEDLVAPWYIWLNRREKETQYEKLEPLEYHLNGMHILRWYGIDLKRNEACPVCGDFGKYVFINTESISSNEKDLQSNEPMSIR